MGSLAEEIERDLKSRAGERAADLSVLCREAAGPYLSWQRTAQQGRGIARVHDAVLERLLLGNMLLMCGMNQLIRESGLRRWDFYIAAHGRLYDVILASQTVEEVMDKGYTSKYLLKLIGDYSNLSLQLEDKRWSDWFQDMVSTGVHTPCPKAPDTWVARGMAERLVELARLRRGDSATLQRRQ